MMTERDVREALAEAVDAEWTRPEHACGGDGDACQQVCPAPAYGRMGLDELRDAAVTALLASDVVARMLAEAEQRGREDNADHGMCYVHGSKALDARLAEARAEALREAAQEARERGDIGKDSGCEAWEWLSIRAEQAAGGER